MAVSSICTQIFWMKPHTQYLRIVTYTNQIFLHRAATTPCPTPCKKVYVANKYRDPLGQNSTAFQVIHLQGSSVCTNGGKHGDAPAQSHTRPPTAAAIMMAATAQAAKAARFAGAPLASLSDDSIVLFRGAFSALLPPCCAFACKCRSWLMRKHSAVRHWSAVATLLQWSVSKQNHGS